MDAEEEESKAKKAEQAQMEITRFQMRVRNLVNTKNDCCLPAADSKDGGFLFSNRSRKIKLNTTLLTKMIVYSTITKMCLNIT